MSIPQSRLSLLATVLTAGFVFCGQAAATEIILSKGVSPAGWKYGKIEKAGGLMACAALRPIDHGRGVAVFVASRERLFLVAGSHSLPRENPFIQKAEVTFGTTTFEPGDFKSHSPGYYSASWLLREAPFKAISTAGKAAIDISSLGQDYELGFALSGMDEVLKRFRACGLSRALSYSNDDDRAKSILTWIDAAIGDYSKMEKSARSTAEPLNSQTPFDEEDEVTATAGRGSGEGEPNHSITIRPDIGLPFKYAGKYAGPSGSTPAIGDAKPKAPKTVALATYYLPVQRELARIGCYTGRIDGDWGRMSRAALRRYLAASGRDDAKVGERLLGRLQDTAGGVCAPPRSETAKAKRVVRKKKARRVTSKPVASKPVARRTLARIRKPSRPRNRKLARKKNNCWEHYGDPSCRTYD